MTRKVTGLVALAGIALVVAVGPGLTLSRCLMTGKVSLSCCCQGFSELGNTTRLVSTEQGCCSFQRVEANCAGGQLVSGQPVFSAPPTASGLPNRLAARSADQDSSLTVPDLGPPPWLSNASIRI